jgi:hypothetical protein
MTFLKYIFELIVILYAVRFVMRLIDGAFASKPVKSQQNQGNTVVNPNPNATNSESFRKPKAPDEDYIEYEEIK